MSKRTRAYFWIFGKALLLNLIDVHVWWTLITPCDPHGVTQSAISELQEVPHEDENWELRVICTLYLPANKTLLHPEARLVCAFLLCTAYFQNKINNQMRILYFETSPEVDTGIGDTRYSRLMFHPCAQSRISMKRCRSIYIRMKISQRLMRKWFFRDLVGQAGAAFVSLTCPHSDGLYGSEWLLSL